MSLKEAAQYLRAQGRGKDTELVHLTKREVAALEGLASAAGGGLTRNPKTGLPEAGFLDSMLPTILGIGANFIVPGSGMIVGGLAGAATNKDNPLMGAALGAMGGYGGGQLAEGLGSLGSSAISPEMLAQAGSAADPIGAMVQAKDFATAAGAQAPSGLGAVQAGLQNSMNNPMGLVNTLGGPQQAAKAAGMAAAPMLYDAAMAKPDDTEKPDWANAEGREFDYNPGYTGGTQVGPDVSSERQWFTPSYKQMAAGGVVEMESGGFVFPADTVSMAGGGSTDAGLAALAKHTGARPIKGKGSGMSDDIPANIDGKPVARVANGEAYVPRETVKKLGGARKLYKVMENIRTQAHGKRQQQRPVDLKKAMA